MLRPDEERAMIAYFNGRFCPKDEVRISPDDRGFVFADGVYEVIRVYGGRVFALEAHRARLARSLREVRLDWAGAGDLDGIVATLLEANGLSGSDALVYLQVTRGVAPRHHAFPPPGTPPTVYGSAVRYEAPHGRVDEGFAAILVPDIRWGRCDIKSIGLLANVLAACRAEERGASEALFVRDGVLTEGTRTNLAAVIDGALVTHPLTTHVLPGITRAVALDLARDLGIPVVERPILETEVGGVEELLLLGTTMEVAAVTHLDGRAVRDGHPGPVARRLQAAMLEHVRGI
jgi:D-alanine transaminase